MWYRWFKQNGGGAWAKGWCKDLKKLTNFKLSVSFDFYHIQEFVSAIFKEKKSTTPRPHSPLPGFIIFYPDIVNWKWRIVVYFTLSTQEFLCYTLPMRLLQKIFAVRVLAKQDKVKCIISQGFLSHLRAECCHYNLEKMTSPFSVNEIGLNDLKAKCSI